MTPLARRITSELTLPIKRRTFDDRAGVLRQMADVHCFECTDVMPLARELGANLPKFGIDERSTFLPAPRTWVEWKTALGGRVGLLLVEDAAKASAKLFGAYQGMAGWYSYTIAPPEDVLKLVYRPADPAHPKLMEAREYIASLEESDEHILALLSIINTPRIVGRRQHMPHRAFERNLVRAMKMVGKFPLHAWTEIKLEVSTPADFSGEASIEAHLTGERALHFCRAHLRIRLGRLEIVRSHWRGDPALGIKQSRYKLSVGA